MVLKAKISCDVKSGVVKETQEEFIETPFIEETHRNLAAEIDQLKAKLRTKNMYV